PLNDRDCFRTLYSRHSIPLPDTTLRELIARKGVYYFRAIAKKPVMFEHAAMAIKEAARRCPLAIASGARMEEIRHILSHAGLHEYFAAIVAAEDVSNGKPHPEPFLRALERLQQRDRTLTAAECVAVEDSIGGIQSAHEAGMRCLGIAHSYDAARLEA